MSTKKQLEEKIKQLQELIYEDSFFMRYLVLDLEKYQEDPTLAIHDMHCPVNDPDNPAAHKAWDKENRVWAHPGEYVDDLCNCKVRAVITAIYEIKMYQEDKKYMSIIKEATEAHEKAPQVLENVEKVLEEKVSEKKVSTKNSNKHYLKNRDIAQVTKCQ